jgi:hypothetical protein
MTNFWNFCIKLKLIIVSWNPYQNKINWIIRCSFVTILTFNNIYSIFQSTFYQLIYVHVHYTVVQLHPLIQFDSFYNGFKDTIVTFNLIPKLKQLNH